MVRAFIAIRCPEELKDGLLEVEEKVKSLGTMKLVEKENIHMTLKFLGEAENRKIEEITAALESLSKKKKFTMSLRGVGVFPSPAYVRVIWVGVGEGAREAMWMQREVDDRLLSLGFPRDERFHPHFTLARVKAIDKEKMRRFLSENTALSLGSFDVAEIDLMESRLSPKGPTYSVINGFKLS